ncbi:hypothetical protein [Legionella rowbothamii]|uniref:hypothetical protein n=1 Tax=Legionella rowbothamii TaxID=96229 RepID=UPI001054A771|nr:hypothetical protein [Legionella rowbothamii]
MFYIDYVIGEEKEPIYLIKSFWFLTSKNRTEAMNDLSLKLNRHDIKLHAIGYENFQSPYSTHSFHTFGPTNWGMAVGINRNNYTKEDINQLFNKLGVSPKAPWYMSAFLIPFRTPLSFLLSGGYNLYRSFISNNYFNFQKTNVSPGTFTQTAYQPSATTTSMDEHRVHSVIYRSKGFYNSQPVSENKFQELADVLNISVKLIVDVEPIALGQGYLIKVKSPEAAKTIEESVRKTLKKHTQNEFGDCIRFLDTNGRPTKMPSRQLEIWGAGATALSELLDSVSSIRRQASFK